MQTAQLALELRGVWRIQLDRAPHGLCRHSVVPHLFVRPGELGQVLWIGIAIGCLAQHLGGLLGVAQVGIDDGEAGERVFIVGVDGQRFFVSLLGIDRVPGDLIEAAEDEQRIHIGGLGVGDHLILLNRLLEHVLIDAILVAVADQARVEASENAARAEVFRVDLQGIFGIRYGLTQAPRLDVEVGKFFRQERSSRVGLDGELIVLDRLVEGVAAVAVLGHRFGVVVGESEVIISSGLIDLQLWLYGLGQESARDDKNHGGTATYQFHNGDFSCPSPSV